MNRSGEIKGGGPKSLLCAQQADSIQDNFPDERRVAACESKSGSDAQISLTLDTSSRIYRIHVRNGHNGVLQAPRRRKK